jgi:hypothetical protein
MDIKELEKRIQNLETILGITNESKQNESIVQSVLTA